MTPDALFELVDPWYRTGSLAETDKPVIQQYYTELTGDSGERCRTCASYWSDVLHTLRVHLKSLGYQSMSNDQKYMIRKDAGFLQVAGLAYAYINKGSAPETESAKFLTDEIAEELLKKNPDNKLLIVANPEYVDKVTTSKADKADAATAKSTQKVAATKKPKTKAKTASEPKVAEPTSVIQGPDAAQSEAAKDQTNS